jgi:hypothetical protein
MPKNKPPEFHVGIGEISGTIYAGTLMRNGIVWKDRSDVTDEAIAAVRDHLMEKAKAGGLETYGYSWKLKDGGKVQLLVKILPKEEDENA